MTTDGKKYYRISLRCEDRIKGFVNHWFSAEDAQRSMQSMEHIKTDEAWKRIHDELFNVEDHFYEWFDSQHLQRDPTRDDWKNYAVPKILSLQNIIYQRPDYHPKDVDKYSAEQAEPSISNMCTGTIAIIRMRCANMIWREWSDERQFGARVGVIMISTKETTAEKILLVAYIREKRLVLGFPKGRPNRDETIRTGGFREFKEETGVYDLFTHFQLLEGNGVVIRKYPHIGPGKYRRTRTHYYIITSTELEDAPFNPNQNEILLIEWHSIYTLPCCDQCKICPKKRLITDQDLSIDYTMVTLKDKDGRNSTIIEILVYIDTINQNDNARNKYRYSHRHCRSHHQ